MYTLGFDQKELSILKPLRNPQKIQDFLETIPINFERSGETCRSPRRVLRDNTAHCLEGAMLAAAALWVHGEPPLLMDLNTTKDDENHVVALFRRNGYWGALSKTNHAVLRYREPIYKTLRELALSYFHEYFLNDGRKTLRSFSKPLDLRSKKYRGWTTAEADLWNISKDLDYVEHENIVPTSYIRSLRRADLIEIKAGKIVEWKE